MTLRQWTEISECFTDALILGNGASIGVHSGFQYESLWQAADDNELIMQELHSLANKLGTGPNFELLLRQLFTAEAVNDQFKIDSNLIKKAYKNLRSALIKTVRNVHCSHSDVSGELQKPAPFLKNFKTIFSLNYDLLLYWVIMDSNDSQPNHKFKDCFTSGSFDADWEKFRNPYSNEDARSLVFYPHGALHLTQTNDGIDQKIATPKKSANLLEEVLNQWANNSTLPLFIAEGDSAKKMRSIQRSSYLSTVYYEALPKSGPSLVIFGWSMDEKVDAHLLTQIGKGEYERLAVAVHRPSTPNIAQFISKTNQKLSRFNIKSVTYFDAESEGSWINVSSPQQAGGK